MPKLPDLSKGHLYELTRAKAPAAPDLGSSLKSGTSAVAKGLDTVGKELMQFHEDERDKRDAIEALDAENKATALLRDQEKALERNPDFDSHEKIFNEGTTAGMKAILGGITNPKVRSKLAHRFWDKHQSVQESVRKTAERGRNSVMSAAAEQKVEDSLKDIENGDLPPAEIAARVRDANANIDHLLAVRAIDPQQHRRMKSDYSNKYGTAAIDAMTVDQDPDVVAGKLEKYRKGRKSFASPEGIVPQSDAAPVLKDNQKTKLQGVNSDVVDRFSQLQGVTGRTFNINSGHRSATHNARVGGAKKSQHIEGNAIDIDVSQMSEEERAQLINTASALGFTGIGVYKNSLHLDMGARRSWGPDYRAGSVPGWAKGAISNHLSNKSKVETPVAKRGLVQYAGLKGDTKTDAAPAAPAVEPEQWHLHQLIGGMSDVEIYEYEQKLRAKAKAKRADQKVIDKAELAGIAQRIRDKGIMTPEDEAFVKKMEKAQPELYAQFQLDKQEAVYFAEAQQITKPDKNEPDGKRVVPIDQMTPSELSDHLEELERKRTNTRASGVEVEARTNAMNDIRKIVNANLELRRRDPSRSVEKHPEVMTAEDRLNRFGLSAVGEKGPDQVLEPIPTDPRSLPPPQATLEQKQAMRRELFQAREQAQANLEIPENERKMITKAEAQALLPWHPGSQVTIDDFKTLLQQAKDKALEWTGDENIAILMVEDAYQLIKGERTGKSEQVDEVNAFRNEAYNPDGSRKTAEKLSRIDRDTGQIDFTKSTNKGMRPLPLPEAPAPSVEWLKANLNDPEAVASFARKYGAEALKNALTMPPLEAQKGVDRWGNPKKETSWW